MKTRNLIAIIILINIIFSCTTAYANLYSIPFLVIGVEETENEDEEEIILLDCEGDNYSFFADKNDFHVNDFIITVFEENPIEDIIIDAIYITTFDQEAIDNWTAM